MKKLIFFCLLLFCFPITTQAKTVYVSVGESVKLPSGDNWKSKNNKIAKVVGKKGKGIKKGTTTFTYKQKNKKKQLKIVVEKPYFSKSYVKLNEKIKLLGTKRYVTYTSTDWNLLDDSFNYAASIDDDNVGGGIVTLDAKVGTETYRKCIRVGNILPYEFVVKKGKTKYLFDKKTRKKLNLNIHVGDPSIVSVSKKGAVKGKKYGTTTIWLRYKGKTYYCKVYCLPKISYSSKTPYTLPIKRIDDYRYILPEKAYQDLKKEKIKFEIKNILQTSNPEYKDEIIMGLYSPAKRTISGRKDVLEAQYLVHEAGHFLDDRSLGKNTSWFSHTDPEYKEFYQKFMEKYPKKFMQTTSEEVFAELYMEYTLCPYRLRDNIPMGYQYMSKLMKKYGYE